MGRWPPRPPSSKFARAGVDYCNTFASEARIPEYDRWPPRPPRSKFIKESVDCCNRFAREAGVLEYGPVAAKAVQEQIHKEELLDLQWVCEAGQDSGIWAGGRQGFPGTNS